MLREIMKEILEQEEAANKATLARIDSLYPVPQPPEASLESTASKFEETAKPEAYEDHLSVNADTSEVDEENLSGGCNGCSCDPGDPFERYERPEGPSGWN